MILSGWGRFPRHEARLFTPRTHDALRALVLSSGNLIARGSGLSYGDSAVNPAATVDMRQFNRMLAFDPATGQLVAEAGVQIGDIITTFLPRGWFPMVTPGTKRVTLGGAIAADVHGKNHHVAGSFRNCVDWIDLMRPDGSLSRCAPATEADLFDHSLGGMGLTGIILRAAIRLRPVESGWIRQQTVACADLDSTLATMQDRCGTEYSVAWIDCLATGRDLGRSILMLGQHAERGDLPADLAARPFATPARRQRTVPLDLPAWALNHGFVKLFNAIHFHRGRRAQGTAFVDWDRFFYPLDTVANWNRIYGARGLAQFQCVLPHDSARQGLTALLSAIRSGGTAPFLSVLKQMGRQEGALSFPMEGYTLAMDFPVQQETLSLLDRLDRIVVDHGGRFYLAKDARMRRDVLAASDARAPAFAAWRKERGLNGKFRSAQSERLDL